MPRLGEDLWFPIHLRASLWLHWDFPASRGPELLFKKQVVKVSHPFLERNGHSQIALGQLQITLPAQTLGTKLKATHNLHVWCNVLEMTAQEVSKENSFMYKSYRNAVALFLVVLSFVCM